VARIPRWPSGLRGKTAPFAIRSRKRNAQSGHVDEIPASCGLRNVPTQVPIELFISRAQSPSMLLIPNRSSRFSLVGSINQ